MRKVLFLCFTAVLLGGCSVPTELDKEAAAQFSTRVAEARQLTAQQDFPAADAQLQQLEQDVQVAAERGRVSADRQARIESSISKIRASLDVAMVPEPQPAPPEENPAEKGAEDLRDAQEDARKDAQKDAEDARKDAEDAQKDAQRERERAAKKGQGGD